MKTVKSSGNVFADIGFDTAKAEELAVKSDLITLIRKAIKSRSLTQKQVAEICETDQPTLSKILSGKMESVTIDRLARWLSALGWNIRVTAVKKTIQKPERARA